MQNKGLIKIILGVLVIVSLYYLSFSFVSNRYSSKAKAYAGGDKEKEYHYLDSLANEKVWLGYTLKECRERELGLGLDLKGGMNVILEVSVPDILRALSNYNTTPNFTKALQIASERQKSSSQATYLDLFVQAYKELDPNAKLASIFSTYELKDKISLTSTNEEVVKVLRQEIDDAISNSFNVLRTRIDRFGVVQPNIQKIGSSGRILIELPGIKEPERVRKLLQGSANLEFWETYDLSEIFNNLVEANRILASMSNIDSLNVAQKKDSLTAQTQTQPSTPAQKSAQKVSSVDSLKAALEKKNESAGDSLKLMEKQKKENPLFSLIQLNVMDGKIGRGPLIGLVHSKDTTLVNSYFKMKQVREVLPRDLGLRWSVKSRDENGEWFELIALKVNTRDGRAPLGGDVITDARADFDQTSAYANVSMSMNAEGAKTWARMTRDNIGKSIAIVLDGYVYSYPTVQNEITGGNSQITGNFTVEEAKDLANVLKSGKMPAPARIVQEDVVGPTLGKEAIQAGLISFIIAFILILLYMQVNYGLIPGLVVDFALLLNVFLMLGIMASFQAVLTLPGMAGIVLTLGMAVDANVLIYERIKEELQAGKNMKKALVSGYQNALSAIIDGNVTTLLTGIILYIFGTGPIRGFATTLIIGLITSVFTSVFVTRIIYESFHAKDKWLDLKFHTNLTKSLLLHPKIDFIGKRKYGYIFSGTILTLFVIALFTKGLTPGVDFSGGRNYIVRFEQPVRTDEIKNSLEDYFQNASLSVITIGNDKQVRINTNYKIDDDNAAVDDEISDLLYNGLKEYLPAGTTKEQFVHENIINSQKVGPSIADDVKTSAYIAVFIAIIVIGLYILMRFRNVAFSVGTIAALFHDVLFIIGCYCVFSGLVPFSLEVDQNFVAALLTIIGYSVNDTVVIFDRIRENLKYYPKRNKKRLMNEALNQTLVRTFSTSLTVFITIGTIFLFGGETIRGFSFAMLIGTIIGVYSTLFIACPIAYEIQKRQLKIVDDDYDDEKPLSKKPEIKSKADNKQIEK